MSNDSLRFKSLDIRQMPGFPDGLYHYEEFDEQINIIAGPNASGKSSTAHALQQMIWPRQGKELQATARLHINGKEWVIQKNLSRLSVQREGMDEELPVRPSFNEKKRYVLSLHDLIKVEDQDLAQLMIQESIGGYDLDQAAEDLKYAGKIFNRSSKPFTQFREAIEKYDDTRKRQSTLKDRYERLDELKQKVRETERAESAAKLFDLQINYLEAGEQLNELRIKLKQFPEGLDRASGEEAERLRDINQSIQKKKTEIADFEREKKSAQKKLDNLDLPQEGVSSEKLDLLEKLSERLKTLQEHVDEREADREEEREKARQALQSLNVDIEQADQWNGIAPEELSNLEEWLQQAYQVTGRLHSLKVEVDQLEEESDQQVPDRDEVKKGLGLLEEWLQTYDGNSDGFPDWGVWGLLTIGILTALATYVAGLGALVGGMAALFILTGYLVMQKWSKQKPSGSAAANRIIENYESTGLPAPQQWTVEEVIETLDRLTGELVRSKREEYRHYRIKQLQSDIRQVEEKKLQDVEAQRDEWMEQLGTMPEVLEDRQEGYSRFYWFINRLNQWQTARERVQGLDKALEKAQEKKQETLEKIQEEVAYLEQDPPEYCEAVEAFVRDLKNREQQRREAVQAIESNEENIRRNRQEIDQFEAQKQKIGEKFGLENPQVEEVERRIDQLEDYQEVKKKFNQAEFNHSQVQEKLKAHPQYDEYKKDLGELDKDRLKRKKEELLRKAEQRDKFKQDIQDIQTRVSQVQENHDLEQALQDKEEAVEKLKELYEENIQSVTGDLLVKKLKRITRDQNRPAVFKRATELFNRITAGRFKLLIEDEDQRFRAYDNVHGQGVSLEQLSTGTRIQLLLSVRLAFIETQEQSLQLPIIADELLANSDEKRAKAIIRALVQLSKEGRQIFYFTAQADEVYKWKSYLEQESVGYELYELGQISGEGFAFYDSYRPPAGSLQMVGKVPEPGSQNHADYGKQLQVPPFSLLAHRVDQLHLWYVIEDVNILYKCLRRNIRYWGGLSSFMEHGGAIEGLNEDKWLKMEDLAKFLERFKELYSQGRSKPIDRKVIEETDAVTENFQEAVADKLYEVEGNPQRLLEALRKGEVTRFQKAKIQELHAYLLEHNYIDESDPLDLDEIHSRLHAFIDSLSINQEETQRLLDRILK